MTKRTDIHRPSAIIPANYEFVVVRTREDNEAGFGGEAIRILNKHREHTGGKFANHVHGGNCDVCGAWFIDYAIFWHQPTNEYIRAGLDCTAKIEKGHADDFRRVAQMRRAAAKRSAEVQDALEYLAEHGVADEMELLFNDNDFGGMARATYDEEVIGLLGLSEFGLTAREVAKVVGAYWTLVDMTRNLIKYGWSEKQLAYAKRLTEIPANAKQWVQNRREEEVQMIDAPEGKVVVTGVVLSIKEEENYFGYNAQITWKMLVMDDSNYKVWTTIPRKILSDVEKGDKVRFSATLTRSDKDRSFAFAKRPSKVEIL